MINGPHFNIFVSRGRGRPEERTRLGGGGRNTHSIYGLHLPCSMGADGSTSEQLQ